MKGKTLSAIGILALALGILVAICYRSITSVGVVVTGGILFVAVGIGNLVIFGQNSRENRGMARLFNQITNAAAIVLGICMLVFESTFAPLVTFIFGLLLGICSLWQFFLLAIGTRPHQLPGWLYIFPLLLLGGAIYIFVQRAAMEHIIMLITGIGFALLGVGCIAEGWALGLARRAVIKASKPTEAPKDGPQEAADAPKPEAPAASTASATNAPASTGEDTASDPKGAASGTID